MDAEFVVCYRSFCVVSHAAGSALVEDCCAVCADAVEDFCVGVEGCFGADDFVGDGGEGGAFGDAFDEFCAGDHSLAVAWAGEVVADDFWRGGRVWCADFYIAVAFGFAWVEADAEAGEGV